MFRTKGFKKLARYLTAQAQVVDDETIIRAGGDVIRDAARENVATQLYRESTGFLASEIVTHVARPREAEIGTRPNRVPYARIHEFGGEITPKRAQALFVPLKRNIKRWSPDLVRGEDYVLVQRVRMPARPYLRPAADATRKEVARTLGDELEIRLKKGVK